jgi:hypothetical protein
MTTTPRLVKSLTQVNTTDAADPDNGGAAVQIDGQIARLPDGGYVVAWSDQSRQDGINPSGAAIIGQRYDALGNKVGGEVELSLFNSGDQVLPAITALPNGNVAIAFVDSFSGDQDVWVRIFDPSLNLVTTSAIDTGANQTSNPSITAFADSSYVITYTVGPLGGDRDIVARVVSSTGAVGAQFDIDNQTDSRDLPEVATLANGNFVVVYHDDFNGDAANRDIKYAIFSPAGTPVAGPNGVPGGVGLGFEVEPDVAALREGGFVVVWTDPDSTVSDIRASILNSNGTALVSNILVNTTTTGAQETATAIALADGGFLVTWEDDNADLVRAQRFDAAGTKIGTEFTVKNGTFAASPEADLLTDGGRIAYALCDFSTGDVDVMTSIWRARDVSHDFDGDGKSGVLWRHDSGQVYFWEMNGLAIKNEGGVAHAPVPNDWHIQGAGDFDGDGNNDVLWRHDNGQVYFWEMNGLQVKAEGGVAHEPVPNDWHIQGTGDFDADGKSDILWRHDSGQVYFWEMDGLQIKTEGPVGHAAVPNEWHILGIGDFNGDSHSDIIWRHDNGQVYIWGMNGLGPTWEGAVAHAAVTNDWHIQGIGDLNGDGNGDIIWRNDSGQVYIWEMDGLAIKTEGAPAHAAVPNDWHIQNVGDFNGDAKSDILWRHDSGQVYVWEMNGLQITAEGAVAHAPVPSDWHIFSQHNFV